MKNKYTLLINRIFNLTFTLILGIKSAFAWGDLGHQAVGEIAEQNLTPEAKSMIREILGIDALANAAIWPDLVRSDSRYASFANYHFFEIPSGFSFATLPAHLRADKSADVMLSRVPLELKSASRTRDEEIILLRYLVHIAGDVHQPLHIGNGVDRGANLCDIQWKAPHAKQLSTGSLHSFIDDHIFEFFRDEFLQKEGQKVSKKFWFGYKELSSTILASKDVKALNLQRLARAPLADWYDESVALREQLYPDLLPVRNPTERVYCKVVNAKTQRIEVGHYDPTKIPILTHRYIEPTLSVLRLQIARAGFRLAHTLNEIAAKRKKAGTLLDDAYENELLKKIQFTHQTN